MSKHICHLSWRAPWDFNCKVIGVITILTNTSAASTAWSLVSYRSRQVLYDKVYYTNTVSCVVKWLKPVNIKHEKEVPRHTKKRSALLTPFLPQPAIINISQVPIWHVRLVLSPFFTQFQKSGAWYEPLESVNNAIVDTLFLEQICKSDQLLLFSWGLCHISSYVLVVDGSDR